MTEVRTPLFEVVLYSHMAEKNPERQRPRVIEDRKPEEEAPESVDAATKRVLGAFKLVRQKLEMAIEDLDTKKHKGNREKPQARAAEVAEVRQKSPRERIWQSLKTEGVSSRNLREFADNAELFTAHELEIILTIVRSLLLEWDFTLHPFLQSLIPDIEQTQALKTRLEAAGIK